MQKDSCIFCQIASGRQKAQVLYQDDDVTAFRDIHPITPVHILIIPNQHFNSVFQAGTEDASLIGKMALVANRLAENEGIVNSGYRLVINTGSDAGQSVFHLHMHLIGGRKMPFRFE